jgi:hypothetical protein
MYLPSAWQRGVSVEPGNPTARKPGSQMILPNLTHELVVMRFNKITPCSMRFLAEHSVSSKLFSAPDTLAIKSGFGLHSAVGWRRESGAVARSQR